MDQFYNSVIGKSVLYGKNPESNRGQCVMLVCFYADAIGTPIIWTNAADWWAQADGKYQRVDPNDISRGDIVVWSKDLPGSGGYGHIAVAWNATPGASTFISLDSNWGGKTAHLVTHNKSYVLGGLRKIAPAPQGDNEVANQEQVQNLYHAVLFRDGDAGGLANYTGQNANTIVSEMLGSGERKDLETRFNGQTQALQDLQNKINEQNVIITNITNDDNLTKQKVQNALTQIGDLNAQLAAAHDQVVATTPLQPAVIEPAQPPNFIIKLLAALFTKKK